MKCKKPKVGDYDYFAYVVSGCHQDKIAYVDGSLQDGEGIGCPAYILGEDGQYDWTGGYTLIHPRDMRVIPFLPLNFVPLEVI